MADNSKKTYSTADLMKAFNIGRNTLRLYEERDLLSGMSRTEAGYRQYSPEHLQNLKFIMKAKEAGFTLNEIGALLKVIHEEKSITCGTVSSEIAEKINEIEIELKKLAAKKISSMTSWERVVQKTRINLAM